MPSKNLKRAPRNYKDAYQTAQTGSLRFFKVEIFWQTGRALSKFLLGEMVWSYLCKGPLEWEERSYPVRPFNSWPVNLEFNLSIHNYVEVQLIGQMHWQGSSFAER